MDTIIKLDINNQKIRLNQAIENLTKLIQEEVELTQKLQEARITVQERALVLQILSTKRQTKVPLTSEHVTEIRSEPVKSGRLNEAAPETPQPQKQVGTQTPVVKHDLTQYKTSNGRINTNKLLRDMFSTAPFSLSEAYQKIETQYGATAVKNRWNDPTNAITQAIYKATKTGTARREACGVYRFIK